MKIILDETGMSFPDACVESFVNRALEERKDIHISQALVVDCVRAALTKMYVDDRPQIDWIFYGKEVTFDKDMRSFNAFHDERMQVWDRAMDAIMEFRGP